MLMCILVKYKSVGMYLYVCCITFRMDTQGRDPFEKDIEGKVCGVLS